MTPVIAANDLRDGFSLNAEMIGKTLLRPSIIGVQAANFLHLIGSQFGSWHAFTPVDTFRVKAQAMLIALARIQASLVACIHNVLLVIAQKQVMRIAALWIVAAMAYQLVCGINAVMKVKGYAVSAVRRLLKAEFPVAVFVFSDLPQPALIGIGSLDVRPKAVNGTGIERGHWLAVHLVVLCVTLCMKVWTSAQSIAFHTVHDAVLVHSGSIPQRGG